jgi:hypothetical protein
MRLKAGLIQNRREQHVDAGRAERFRLEHVHVRRCDAVEVARPRRTGGAAPGRPPRQAALKRRWLTYSIRILGGYAGC